MNYEELLASKSDGRLNKSQMPIGLYYREQVNGKYCGRVDIRPEMGESILYTEALKTECEKNTKLLNSHQLHFTPVIDGTEIKQLEVESGNYLSFEQLLEEAPAVVAEKDFAMRVLTALVDITSYLHQQGMMHESYSPRTVMVRKGDKSPMLLSHGSFYMGLGNLEEFYGADSSYVAPEVMNHGTIDERCDVYSIGKFMEYLLEPTGIPIEYRSMLKKATSQAPEDRYERPEDMLKDVRRRKSFIRSAVTFVLALLIASVAIYAYFDSFPESSEVEFVKPAPRQPTDDLLDDGFDPAELGVVSGDSLTEDDLQAQREFEAKAEEIFRKKYEKEADRILSKIYNNEHMSNSEKKFAADNQSTIDELMKAQSKIGEEAGLDPTRSQLIATEIIDRVTEKKKGTLGGTNSRAIQK